VPERRAVPADRNRDYFIESSYGFSQADRYQAQIDIHHLVHLVDQVVAQHGQPNAVRAARDEVP
jgi:hypothetical protein